MTELKPCPLCGRVLSIRSIYSSRNVTEYQVACTSTNCSFETPWQDENREMLVAEWGRAPAKQEPPIRYKDYANE